MASDEKQPLFADSAVKDPGSDGFPPLVTPSENRIYETFGSPRRKYLVLGFTVTIIICVLITIVLSIVRAHQGGPLYLLLGISIICITLVELGLIYLCKSGDIPYEKVWFVFFVGFCIFMESIFTNVILYAK